MPTSVEIGSQSDFMIHSYEYFQPVSYPFRDGLGALRRTAEPRCGDRGLLGS